MRTRATVLGHVALGEGCLGGGGVGLRAKYTLTVTDPAGAPDRRGGALVAAGLARA